MERAPAHAEHASKSKDVHCCYFIPWRVGALILCIMVAFGVVFQMDASVQVYAYLKDLCDSNSKDEEGIHLSTQMLMIILMDLSINTLATLKFLAYLFASKEDFHTRMHIVEGL